MQTLYLLGLNDDMNNHMFKYYFTHSAYYYTITTTYSIVSGVVKNVS